MKRMTRAMTAMPLVIFASLVVLATSGCATGPARTPSVDVTGRWKGTWSYSGGSGGIWLDLRQEGTKVSGELRMTGTALQRNGPVEGSVAGNELTFARVETVDDVRGELSVSADTIQGFVVTSVKLQIAMRREQR